MPRFQALTQTEDGPCFQVPWDDRERWRDALNEYVAWSHLVEVSTGNVVDSYHRPGGKVETGTRAKRPATT